MNKITLYNEDNEYKIEKYRTISPYLVSELDKIDKEHISELKKYLDKQEIKNDTVESLVSNLDMKSKAFDINYKYLVKRVKLLIDRKYLHNELTKLVDTEHTSEFWQKQDLVELKALIEKFRKNSEL